MAVRPDDTFHAKANTMKAVAMGMAVAVTAAGFGATAAGAEEQGKQNMEKCHGVAKAAQNDCDSGPGLPLIPPAVAAYAATTAEHLFPALLVVGCSRVSRLWLSCR
jgi:uncharacterized membrane protein